MATPADFNAYDISQDMKRAMARVVSEIEAQNTRLLDKYQDLQAKAQALQTERGAAIQEARTLRNTYDRNKAAIQEIYDKLPPVPTP